jgi:hypothetical protein
MLRRALQWGQTMVSGSGVGGSTGDGGSKAAAGDGIGAASARGNFSRHLGHAMSLVPAGICPGEISLLNPQEGQDSFIRGLLYL